jgi:hypothetical protein
MALGAEVWRDYVVSGSPSSGVNNPAKSDIRAWAAWVEGLPGVRWNFETSTTMAAPATGGLRLNNATIASATAIAVNALAADSGNPSVRALVNSWDNLGSSSARGYLTLRKIGASEVFAVFLLTGTVTDNTIWLQLAVTYVAGSGSLSAADGLSIGFAAAGAAGPSAMPGKQSIWVPAAAWTSRTTNGADVGLAEMSSNKNMVRTLDFDATTQQFAQFDIRMPKSWDEGTISFIPVWSHAATTVNFGVVWGLDAVAVSSGDALDVAFGTAQTSTTTGGTTNTSYQGAESSAITIAGTPATGDLVMLRIHRDPANGSDTLAIDARLHGVLVLFTNDTFNDA